MAAIKSTIPTTITEFAEACRELKSDPNGRPHDDPIYVLFEKTIDADLHQEIYNIAERFDPEDSEPVRLAFNIIGAVYNVKTLLDW